MEKLIDRISKAPPALKYGGVAAVILLLTVLNFFLLVQPTEAAIDSQRAQLRRLEDQLAEKKAIAQNLNERRKEMAALEQQLAEALTELPEGKDIDELLAQLNDIGKKSGLEISRIEPGAETPAQFFARIPVKMAVTGNYHEIAMFLQEVANMRRIVNVNNIKLGGADVKSDKVVLKSEFMATTFRFVAQAPEAADKAKTAKTAAKRGKKL
ncbi:MAG TPA: type 4a pilus biogenesis protein PilO [Myxococcaceae bacterium]|nr:type 4a pilus biogenesis protein PilO [Myxococcaceae bacterium]HZA49516.1 type 4a pilus biogenesis protein PilO [Myxococcaceae bacterium]